MAPENRPASEEQRQGEGTSLFAGDRSMAHGRVPRLPDDSGGQGVGSSAEIALYGKLHEMMARIPRIAKDKNNTSGNYKYASDQAIKEVVQPLLVELRLLVLPIGQELIQLTPPHGDKKSYLTTISCSFAIVDVDSGFQLPLTILGSGGDSLDKGVYKGQTGAYKYLWFLLLGVPTGDDPERDGGERVAPRQKQSVQQTPESVITDAQLKRIHALIRAHGREREWAVNLIGSFGYESSKHIKVKDYEPICLAIQEGQL